MMDAVTKYVFYTSDYGGILPDGEGSFSQWGGFLCCVQGKGKCLNW